MTARHPDVLDSFDNVMAAAVHLRGKVGGRPIPNLDDLAYRALCGYYGACADGIAGNYAADVLERARSWQRDAGSASSGVPALGQTGALAWPVRGPVTSPFCERRAWEACHPGIDIGVPTGTPILAAAAGRVSVVQAVRQLGRLRQLHLPSAHQRADHLLRPPGAVPRPRRRDRRPRAADRGLRLHRALLRIAPALRGPPRRPGRLPCPLPRCADKLDVRPGVARLMTRAIALRVLAVALAVAITGCQDPYARDRARPASPPAARPSATPGDIGQPGPPAGPVPSSAARPSAFAAGRRPIVRDALGQLGLAVGRRPAANARSPRDRRSRAAAARKREQRPRRRDPRARQARSTGQRRRDRPQGRQRPRRRASSSRASRPTPTDAPTSAAGATASTSSASTRDAERVGGERMGAAAIAARIQLPRAARRDRAIASAPRLRRARWPARRRLRARRRSGSVDAGPPARATGRGLERGAGAAHRGRPASRRARRARRPSGSASARRARPTRRRGRGSVPRRSSSSNRACAWLPRRHVGARRRTPRPCERCLARRARRTDS